MNKKLLEQINHGIYFKTIKEEDILKAIQAAKEDLQKDKEHEEYIKGMKQVK